MGVESAYDPLSLPPPILSQQNKTKKTGILPISLAFTTGMKGAVQTLMLLVLQE